jgi:hypothetical protein
MDRTVKFFEDDTEIITRYTGTHFTYVRGKIHGEIKQFGGGKVTKFTVSASNGKDRDSGKWKPSTFYDCTAFGDKGQEIKDRYSDKDEIELILKYAPSKSGDKYYYGFNVIDAPRMKPEDGNSAQGYTEDPDDSLPF